MSFLNVIFLGVRVVYWLYFLMSLVCGLIALIYWKREKIKETYYKIRFPEKTIKVVIHYPTGLYKVFWRLIPNQKDFSLEGKRYFYNDDAITKENDFYVQTRGNQLIARIRDGETVTEYNLDDKLRIKRHGSVYPEIHFVNNIPTPINFKDMDTTDIKFTATDLKEFKENHLFEELLTLEGKKNLMILIMLIGGLNLLVTLFLLAKNMGWLK